jgi:hypothetical protein
VEILGHEEAEIKEIAARQLLSNVLDSDVGLSYEPDSTLFFDIQIGHGHDGGRNDSLKWI